MESAEEAEQAFDGQARNAADLQRHPESASPARLDDGVVESREDLARLLGEDAARLCRGHDPARPGEELDAELLLELPDRLRERRVGRGRPRPRPGQTGRLSE